MAWKAYGEVRRRLTDKMLSITAGRISFGQNDPGFSYTLIEYDKDSNRIRFKPAHELNGQKVTFKTKDSTYNIGAARFLKTSGMPLGLYYKIDEYTYQHQSSYLAERVK